MGRRCSIEGVGDDLIGGAMSSQSCDGDVRGDEGEMAGAWLSSHQRHD